MTSGLTADGFTVRNSTPGIIASPHQAVDSYVGARGGTWDDAVGDAVAAHRAELAARGSQTPPPGAGLQAIASETPEPAPVPAEAPVTVAAAAPAPVPAPAPAAPAPPAPAAPEKASI
jgi:hypothetical protein